MAALGCHLFLILAMLSSVHDCKKTSLVILKKCKVTTYILIYRDWNSNLMISLFFLSFSFFFSCLKVNIVISGFC